jgi:isopenicillin N synthase-like dioxygenase
MSEIKPVEPANIPTVDFNLLSQGTLESRKVALKQLDDAFQTYGFIYLSNHSIGQDMVDEALSWVSVTIPSCTTFNRIDN